jgi:hypothetical protein
MPLDYDVTCKFLLEFRLPDWVPLSRRPANGPVEAIDADVSTVTAAADKVLRINADPPWILHVEPHSYHDLTLLDRAHLYNSVIEHRHNVLVWTLIVLQHPRANASNLTGRRERSFPGEPPYRTFQYEVLRVWERPASDFLNGGLGVLPLAPISAVTEADLPGIIQQMRQRVDAEAQPGEVGEFWTATDILMGLRYESSLVAQLLRGVHNLRDSTTYQAILAEGRVEGVRATLLDQGRFKFGPPTQEIQARLEGITDPDRLKFLSQRLLMVSSWDELLAVP